MTSLAQRFNGAGETFVSQTTGISGSVDRALEAFVEQMRALDGEARMLADEINAEMARLDGQARNTTWTGGNRQKMDGIVASLDDDIVRIKAAIEGFVDEASTVVNGSLTTTMNELRTNAQTAGSRAGEVASGFSRSIESQRANFDQVMNG